MADDLEIKCEHFMDAEGGGMAIVAKFGSSALVNEHMAVAVMQKISTLVAERYVAENFKEIVEGISPEAIANLSIAESAAKIRETLEKKIPERVMTIEKTRREVWKRGLLGGMSRVE